ncbi:MAG: 7-carboxy-7-deazaguanine synthase QueE [Gammaproteobacteria bacterium]|jgi:7-carboxy-7-deazaguanine synthase
MLTSSVQAPGQTALRITEIFYSIQGESKKVGLPTVFIRLTGCPLRCHYCDTAYAFYGGEDISIEAILQRVAGFNAQHVTVTGGEPLVQKNCLLLLKNLCDVGYQVSLETSGALDISEVDKRVMKVLDLKTPGSREEAKNRYDNIEYLSNSDQIKFVLCDRNDYEWTKGKIKELGLAKRCEILFSPSHEELDAATLADWILEDRLPVRLQIQIHKYLWGNVRGK